MNHAEFIAFTNSRIGKHFSTGFLSPSLCESLWNERTGSERSCFC